jgi:hypothetical protein
MILNKLNPAKAYTRLSLALEDFLKYRKYKKIIFELSATGKITDAGFNIDDTGNLYLGINLNPELLLYSETSQESVELKLISEKLKKYNDFLTKEGILDYVKMDYDRVKTDEYYGYILKIRYNFTNFQMLKFLYDFGYLLTLMVTAVFGTIFLIS